MGQRWHVRNQFEYDSLIAHINMLRLAGKPPVLEFVQGKRTLSQNDMSFALYTQISRQKQDESLEDIRRQCKLEHGIPILRGDDKFKALYDKVVRPHDYETKLGLMAWFPVTSLMNKAQFSEYIDSVIRSYSQQGISIVMPGEE